jgi:hypothetical protein
MGTRSLTIVLEKDSTNECMVLYRQFDGYPDGHGQELIDFIKDIEMVNGIGCGPKRHIANGMHCLAAQIVAHFKTEAGQFYLYPSGTRDLCEEYIYYLSLTSSHQLHIKVCEPTFKSDKKGYSVRTGEKLIFECDIKDWQDTMKVALAEELDEDDNEDE